MKANDSLNSGTLLAWYPPHFLGWIGPQGQHLDGAAFSYLPDVFLPRGSLSPSSFGPVSPAFEHVQRHSRVSGRIQYRLCLDHHRQDHGDPVGDRLSLRQTTTAQAIRWSASRQLCALVGPVTGARNPLSKVLPWPDWLLYRRWSTNQVSACVLRRLNEVFVHATQHHQWVCSGASLY